MEECCLHVILYNEELKAGCWLMPLPHTCQDKALNEKHRPMCFRLANLVGLSHCVVLV